MGFKNYIKSVLKAVLNEPGRVDAFKKDSWSQAGEDILVEYLFGLRKITTPVCLDIGAYHPVFANNTYKFYQKGSSVVNVDANPAAIALFKTFRPTDVNLNLGVGKEAGSFDFYIMDDEALNTFSSEEKDSLLNMGKKLTKTLKIEMLPVNEIIKRYFAGEAPDFISIDAEGVDTEIIASFDFEKYAPKVICIETINYSPDGTGSKRTDLCNQIEQEGYFEYANTNINSIYVQNKWWFKS